MSKPKVTIIIPVFNVKKFLPECLDSVLNQSLSEIEVICGDGGSTDGSLEILHEYEKKDSRFIVVSKNGSGYGQSINDCMDLANGEYIGIVESDDSIRQDMYEKMYTKAKENDLDWIKGDVYLYYSGRKRNQLVREPISNNAAPYNVVLNPQTDYRPYQCNLRTWSGIYKTDYLRRNGIRHNETPGGSYQDVGFFLKTMYFAERVMFIDEPFYLWRQDNPGSSIHYDSEKLVKKSLKEWELEREYLDSHNELGQMAYGCYNHRKFLSYRWTIQMGKGTIREYAENIAKQELLAAMENKEIDKQFFQKRDWNELNKLVKTGHLCNPIISKIKRLIGQ